jgi:hypothetical protein
MKRKNTEEVPPARMQYMNCLFILMFNMICVPKILSIKTDNGNTDIILMHKAASPFDVPETNLTRNSAAKKSEMLRNAKRKDPYNKTFLRKKIALSFDSVNRELVFGKIALQIGAHR